MTVPAPAEGLPLVAFERYMLAADAPDYPMAFAIRLVFSGALDRRAFDDAVLEAVRRHPLLASRVEGRGRLRPRWVAASDPRPFVDHGVLGAARMVPGAQQIDIERGTGVRIWVRTVPARAELTVQFHHACCDGIGAYRFVEDLLVAYDRAVRGEGSEADFRPLDVGLLRGRGRFGLGWAGLAARFPFEVWGVLGALGFLLFRPAPLVSPGRPVIDEAARLELVECPSQTLDEADSEGLRAAARAHGVTLNEVLLRDLLVAMHRWNVRHDPATRRRGLRLMVPVSLRGPADDAMPAANVVAMFNLDRRPHRFRDPRRALRVIAWEMGVVKRFRLTLGFVRWAAIGAAFPALMERFRGAGRCWATGVLSNMGRVLAEARMPRRDGRLVAGDLVLEEVHSAPPVGGLTVVGLTSLWYAGRLTLTMNYDRRHFTPRAAAELLEEMAGELRLTARTPAAGPAPPA